MDRNVALICENDPDVLWRLQNACEDLGFEVEISPDGLHALTRALPARPSLVFVAAELCGLSGLRVCSRLRLDARFSGAALVVVGDGRNTSLVSACVQRGLRFLRWPYPDETMPYTPLVELVEWLRARNLTAAKAV